MTYTSVVYAISNVHGVAWPPRPEGEVFPVAVWGKADRPDEADTARRPLVPHSALKTSSINHAGVRDINTQDAAPKASLDT